MYRFLKNELNLVFRKTPLLSSRANDPDIKEKRYIVVKLLIEL